MKNCVRPFKFNLDENNLFFWGCLHLNHNPQWEVPLWKMRGFASVEEHNQVIEDNWNSCLNNESVIFLLGDTSFGHEAEQYMDAFFNRVPFKECYWMSGNHTAGWNQFLDKSDSNSQVHINGKTIQLIPNYAEILINTTKVVACHYPIISWNNHARGSYMVHAHVHGTLENSEIGKLLYKSKIKEVSIEKQSCPISVSQLKEYFNK